MLKRTAADRQVSNASRRAHRTQLDALARADLLNIARYCEFGTSELPDTEKGEDFLLAYLIMAMPTTQVFEVTQWATGDRLGRIARKAEAERRKHDQNKLRDRLGEIIEFSFDKLKALKRDYGIVVKHVPPFDAQSYEVRAFWKTERREWEREHKRNKRQQERRRKLAAAPILSPCGTLVAGVPTPSKRGTLVHQAMRGGRWASVPTMMKILAPIMRNERNRPLKPDALRKAITRSIDELVRCGLAEDKIEPDEHGRGTRFARYADRETQ